MVLVSRLFFWLMDRNRGRLFAAETPNRIRTGQTSPSSTFQLPSALSYYNVQCHFPAVNSA